MDFKNQPSAYSLQQIELTLSFIRAHSPPLVERAGDSKWTTGKVVFAFADDKPGNYVYMVGALKKGKVSWHMMPLYGVPEISEKWAKALAAFSAGKSCIHFSSFAELPQDALLGIVKDGTPLFAERIARQRSSGLKSSLKQSRL